MKKSNILRALLFLILSLYLPIAGQLTTFAEEGAVTVYNQEEFITALTNPQFHTIKFGSDIAITKYSISIETRRTNPDLIIDGQGFNLTEYFVGTYDAAAGLKIIDYPAKSTLKTVTLKNFNKINGGNGYGTIYVSESFCKEKAITLIYDNITYSGPQLTCNPKGTAIYRNTSVTIDFASKYTNGIVAKKGTYAGEIAEISNVIIEGTNQFIKKNDTDGPADEFFWIKPEGNGIEIVSGAKVNVVSETVNQPTPGGFIYGSDSKYHFIIREGAEFSYTGYRIFTEYIGPNTVTLESGAKVYIDIKADNYPLGNGVSVFQIGESLHIDENASFNLVTTGENPNSALAIGSSLIAEENSVVQIVSLGNQKKAACQTLIAMGVDSIGRSFPIPSVQFNQPKSVLFYNSNDTATNNYNSAISFLKEGTLQIKSHNIEFWDSASKAGAFTDLNRSKTSSAYSQDLPFELETTVSSLASGSLTRGLVVSGYYEPEKLQNSNFSIMKQNVICINGSKLPMITPEASILPTVDEIVIGADYVTGKGAPGSLINIYMPDGIIVPAVVSEDGTWFAAHTKKLTGGESISVTQTVYSKEESKPIIATVKKVLGYFANIFH